MKNSIPVHVYSYRKSYYLTHPWKIFHEWWTAIKNLYARMRRGYAWIDLWNLDTYTAQMFANALDDLANGSTGAPFGHEDWPTFEDWTGELHFLSRLIHLCNHEAELDGDVYFWDEFSKWREDAAAITAPYGKYYVITEEELKEINECENKYWRIHEATLLLRRKAFSRLAEIWPTLWD